MALVEAFALGVCARARPTGPAVLVVRAKVKSLDAPLPEYGYVAPVAPFYFYGRIWDHRWHHDDGFFRRLRQGGKSHGGVAVTSKA